MQRNYVKQFMVTLVTITMFTGYPFFTRAEDLNGGGKLPSDLSTGLIDLARGETGGLKKLISDAVELAITSFGGTALPSDKSIDQTTNLGGYHFKDYAGNGAVLNGNIGNLSEIVFNNNAVTFEIGSDLRGGGILSADENQQIGNIDNAVFSNNTVTKDETGSFKGGGIIGAYRGTIGDISNSIFNDNIVTTQVNIEGGGILGIYGVQAASASIGAVKNDIFSGNTVTSNRYIYGGGILGVYNNDETEINTAIGDVDNNLFTDNVIHADDRIRGGGILGAMSQQFVYVGSSTIGDITNNIFSGNNITASAIVGGGIVGANTNSTIGAIVNNVFDNNTVTASGSVWNGGIVGAFDHATIGDIIDCTFTNNVISGFAIQGGIIGTFRSTIGDISGSTFADNTITADTSIDAGILYLEHSLTVTDSQFTDNTFTSLQTPDNPMSIYGGAITMNTGASGGNSTPPTTLSLTIAATTGNTTIFRNNEINDVDGKRTNSISIRSVTADFFSSDDATLTISPFGGGAVYLYDPIYVEQNNGKTFGMEVTQTGHFYWGGDNKFIVDAPDAEKNTVNLGQYTTTILMRDFNLDAPNHDFNMGDRANLHIQPGTSMNVHTATLTGMLGFYLQGVSVNNQDNPLLTVTADSINIDGMWPQIAFSGDTEPLQFGDKYYLLHGSTILDGNIIADKEIQTIQHGSLFEFTFKLRKDGDNDFIAELIESDGGGGTPVVPGAKSITEGASVGAALANQGADLAAGAGMGSAINSAKEDAWGAFAVVDASSMRYNTGSRIDTSSVNLMAGISRNINTEIGKLTAGAFFEYGGTSYDIHGSGNASYIGGGLLGHLKFNDVGPGHFYTEAAARIGGLNNDYESNRLKDVSGRKASFDTESTYYGIHAGVGYVWNITEEASLDVYGKYFWLHQDGNDGTISTGELVSFDPIDSHRLRGGARFAYAINEYISPYIGAAFEYEFDGKARASVWGYDLKAAKLEGETGIGEAGLIFKPFSKFPWLVDLGVQGYVGKREGVSGSLRVGLEF